MRRFSFLGLVIGIMIGLPGAAQASVLAKIDKSTQTMRVYVNGSLQHTWKVSTGRGRYNTPVGQWRPKYLVRMHYSRKYNNSPMPYSIFFKGGYAVHGTKAVSRLGRRASHGCIRLRTSNAKKLYSLVRRHGKSSTRIMISNSNRFVKGYSKRKTYRKKTAKRRVIKRRKLRLRKVVSRKVQAKRVRVRLVGTNQRPRILTEARTIIRGPML